ncbi:hypothetical protein FH972_025254 [Carpinus fangiana]|uniref:Gnk2-homologous domain-containing protein n=1 Tax=Carpinus fangiana TaxID=176857 RepID=A0A5N6L0V6_9ROSI|nr:hypothetical protein FH972_025254 [Carpinus fangiana]
MKKEFPSLYSGYVVFLVVKTLLLLETAVGDPRTQTVQVACGHQLENNATIFVPNFVATMENISEQMRVSGFGVAVTGSGPDNNFGLAQCYGDLPLLDCVLCYAEARTVLPQCFPYNGGRIYLDGCFMRSENYSFFQEYKGPGDTAVCGNSTRKNLAFEASVREAVTQAVVAAPNHKGYAGAQVAVAGAVNESAYVLADCWRSLNASSCRECLDNASSSIFECLPWSEGRALYTGCFMRYSDKDFLNKQPGNGSSRGTTIVIVVSVVSSVVVLVVAIAIGVYIWKRRHIQKKRRGSNDARKLVKTLNDSSLNFKGYMAPEYLAHGQLTEKVDVYSFGVLVLEIVMGRQNNRSKTSEYLDSLVTITWKHFRSGTVEQLYDPNMMLHNHQDSNVMNEVFRVMHIGLLCTQETQSLRPTMSKALQMLTKKEEHLPAPTNPPFMDEGTMELNDTCEDPFYHFKAGISDSIATVADSSFYPSRLKELEESSYVTEGFNKQLSQKEFPSLSSGYVIFLVVKTVTTRNSSGRSKSPNSPTTGSGPDTNFGLAQCFGDLPLLDCVLCYTEARTNLLQCIPHNQAHIYLNSYFMRSNNYSFFHEYKGLGDMAMCANTTRKNSAFKASVREAVMLVVAAAPNQKGYYARAEVAMARAVNKLAYVLASLAECWRSLNASSCRECLDNASASVFECLPWSEGRAPNTSCFMRYSNKDFLNKQPKNESLRGN